jgi:drug/metabolite transporter (DMT)-like permease
MPTHRPTVAFARLSPAVRGACLMVCSCAAFAIMMALVRYVSQTIHPFEAAFFRNLIGLAFMLPWVIVVGVGPLRTGRMKMHILRSLFGLCAMLCLFWSLSVLPLAEATALTFTAPLFATIGAALVLGERVRGRRLTATAVGFAGALIVLRPGTESIRPAALVALVAAVFIAAAMLSVKSLSRTEHPNAVVVIMGLLMTPASLIPALWVWTTPPLALWPWLIALGLSATIGQVLLVRAFATADASLVMSFDFTRLIFVSTLGFVAFGQRPDMWTWLGSALIIAASVYITHREARMRLPPTIPSSS